ncbi:hypothetical protein BDK51DRAFT_43127 [Blyttiomyces helicus]|uniref:Peroxidase n=1 Tax=Blyttiomyces helicus TaxID=388810 RepID=A0A4P9WJZ6_9FUNG|nr:hypothetical protein BDK51DRAFT_43127 [Blyttiomyces helicus]|eukprot:RKO92293.1 hypothetical protein BDK51DRAFT_43127 [Blyttiomyces helicus]
MSFLVHDPWNEALRYILDSSPPPPASTSLAPLTPCQAAMDLPHCIPMFSRVLTFAAALAAIAPLVSAGGGTIENRPDAIYQAFADEVISFISKNGCGGESAVNPSTGRVLPPIWLRFAFHDSALLTEYSNFPATWFQANGSFGFDGSIINEFGRHGNEGLAREDMADQFLKFFGTDATNSSILLADTMNLAAIATIKACGGPQIKFTSGLSHPGPDPENLLPLPTDSNELSVTNMERMGFNASQIVAIVTGSHTLGGVHAANNPDLTNEEFSAFDFTPEVFDNDIFKQVINGDCRIPFDCFLAQNEPYKSFVQLYASDQDAFFEAYADAYGFMTTFNFNANVTQVHPIVFPAQGSAAATPIAPTPTTASNPAERNPFRPPFGPGRDAAFVKVLQAASGRDRVVDLHFVTLVKKVHCSKCPHEPESYCGCEEESEDYEEDPEELHVIHVGVKVCERVDERDEVVEDAENVTSGRDMFAGRAPTTREYEESGYESYDVVKPTIYFEYHATLLVVSIKAGDYDAAHDMLDRIVAAVPRMRVPFRSGHVSSALIACVLLDVAVHARTLLSVVLPSEPSADRPRVAGYWDMRALVPALIAVAEAFDSESAAGALDRALVELSPTIVLKILDEMIETGHHVDAHAALARIVAAVPRMRKLELKQIAYALRACRVIRRERVGLDTRIHLSLALACDEQVAAVYIGQRAAQQAIRGREPLPFATVTTLHDLLAAGFCEEHVFMAIVARNNMPYADLAKLHLRALPMQTTATIPLADALAMLISIVKEFGCDEEAAATLDLPMKPLIRLSQALGGADATTFESLGKFAVRKLESQVARREEVPIAMLEEVYDLIAGGFGGAAGFLSVMRKMPYADHAELVLRALSKPSTATAPLARALAQRHLSSANQDHIVAVACKLLALPESEQDIARFFCDTLIRSASTVFYPLLPAVLKAVQGPTVTEHYRRLARHRISLIESQKPGEFSWYQPLAKLPSHRNIERFLRGGQRTMAVPWMEHAREVARLFRGDGAFCPEIECSATVEVVGHGRNHGRCVITKTRGYYEWLWEEWRGRQEEARRLEGVLGGV